MLERVVAGLASTEARLKQQLIFSRAGDTSVYRQFLEGLSGRLRIYLRRRLPHRLDDVEDILQETLLAVHDALHTYEIDRSLTAWVLTIARYKLMDFFRRHARREALHVTIDDVHLFARSDMEATEAFRDLMGLLKTLPDRHRRPIELVKLHGFSIAEAARGSGLSTSAVKVGIHRGLKALAVRAKNGKSQSI